MKSLRIIIGSLNVGGTEKHLAMILPILVQQGWQIKIITLQITRENHLLSLVEAAGITVNSPKSWFNLPYLPRFLRRNCQAIISIFRLWKDFKKDKFSITHFFLPEAYLLGVVAAVFARLSSKMIMSRRSLNEYQKNKPMLRWLELRCHSKMDFILGNSDRIMQQLHHDEGVPLSKLRRIYNGIDVDRYTDMTLRSRIRNRFNIRNSDVVFIIVANLLPYKAHEDLLNAFALVREGLPKDWRLLCVGRDQGMLDYLTALADKLGIADHILWLGACENIAELLIASDIGVLCSHEEGFSNAILESMAAGLPMIVSDVGGNTEAVIHNETGLVVPPKNPKALAECLRKLANDPELAKKLGQFGKTRVTTYFSLAACVTNYEKFYGELIAELSDFQHNSHVLE